MIYGNGIDIIDINRIRKVIDKYGNRFKKRCFSVYEIERSEKTFPIPGGSCSPCSIVDALAGINLYQPVSTRGDRWQPVTTHAYQ